MSLATASAIDRARIATVRPIIGPHIRYTPVLQAAAADFGLDPSLHLSLKLEQLQHSGSFKVRGAFANLLTQDLPTAGVVAASGGNHGAAVAFAAMRLGVPARIFVPTVASPIKLRQIRDYGADLVVEGERYADALAASERWIATSGALPVHAYDQPGTLLGTGTLGAEIEEQVPELDTLLVAVGGGGLIGGIAAWFAGPRIRIVGVEPGLAPTLTKALAAGRPVDAEAGGIAADSLAPARVGELMFPLAQRQVDHVVLVTDDAIRQAQRALWQVIRVVAEPGGGRAGWRRRVRRGALRGIPATPGRTGRGPGLRGQHHGGGLRAIAPWCFSRQQPLLLCHGAGVTRRYLSQNRPCAVAKPTLRLRTPTVA